MHTLSYSFIRWFSLSLLLWNNCEYVIQYNFEEAWNDGVRWKNASNVRCIRILKEEGNKSVDMDDNFSSLEEIMFGIISGDEGNVEEGTKIFLDKEPLMGKVKNGVTKGKFQGGISSLAGSGQHKPNKVFLAKGGRYAFDKCNKRLSNNDSDDYDDDDDYDEKYENRKYEDRKYENGKYENRKYKNGKYENGKYENGKYGNGKYENEKYENGKYENGKYENEKYKNGKYENGKYENGKYKNGKYENRKYENKKYEEKEEYDYKYGDGRKHRPNDRDNCKYSYDPFDRDDCDNPANRTDGDVRNHSHGGLYLKGTNYIEFRDDRRDRRNKKYRNTYDAYYKYDSDEDDHDNYDSSYRKPSNNKQYTFDNKGNKLPRKYPAQNHCPKPWNDKYGNVNKAGKKHVPMNLDDRAKKLPSLLKNNFSNSGGYSSRRYYWDDNYDDNNDDNGDHERYVESKYYDPHNKKSWNSQFCLQPGQPQLGPQSGRPGQPQFGLQAGQPQFGLQAGQPQFGPPGKPSLMEPNKGSTSQQKPKGKLARFFNGITHFVKRSDAMYEAELLKVMKLFSSTKNNNEAKLGTNKRTVNKITVISPILTVATIFILFAIHSEIVGMIVSAVLFVLSSIYVYYKYRKCKFMLKVYSKNNDLQNAFEPGPPPQITYQPNV
ncbi:Plasmodium exported protein, unknown function [Plasmodium knowlesi strain H]|uniref:Pv-fam-d protein n=3 Tax=Plasmodium knowlesi TaxID=5850 RepID=A0A1A7W0K6_PLAKH|nr:Plasmodium exported protein, unknown function [Plasmodium knowlesi strain H]OTN64617.1 Uncharacterized protein PKNOH_S130166600 [Plasmodium knowlesi]CAA9988839.1 Plasmodium exported protein, unknown function [Plasmodium knowlesi strain H]SBO24662.1 Plasmodium exported protein, unknown function [Plasmodium knowlesi strain H]SBO27948.1 Plasmodium exported protein, unknown function [Plasmodium knowlesi strain H]VVS78313.1 Plasmodium exported protein, unknown function [Plasmodium knowlesi strai